LFSAAHAEPKIEKSARAPRERIERFTPRTYRELALPEWGVTTHAMVASSAPFAPPPYLPTPPMALEPSSRGADESSVEVGSKLSPSTPLLP